MQSALSQAAPVSALPNLDPDAHFKGKMGGTFGKDITEVLPAGKRVAVAGFRVAFITDNTATATVRASYMPGGRDTSGARSTLHLALAGVDTAAMQAVTDKAYADFLAQMKLSGRVVVPQDDLKEFLAGVDASAAPGKPVAKEAFGQKALIFAPTGMPLWFGHSDAHWGDKSPFDQKNIRSMADYSHKLNAIAIAPLIVVNFAQMSSSGNQSGFVASSAETGAALSMRVTAFATHYMRSEETRGGLVMKGDEGYVSMAAPFISKLEFGSVREMAASDNAAVKGVFDALGKGMGMANAGGAAMSKSESVAETNSAAYSLAAIDALTQATGTFAKLFQKYPAP